MKNNYKLQFILASVPFLGVLFAWIISWVNIYKITRNKKCVFTHGLFWLLLFGVLGALLSLEIVLLMPQWEKLGKLICIISAIIVCLIMAYFSIWLQKRIIKSYNTKYLSI